MTPNFNVTSSMDNSQIYSIAYHSVTVPALVLLWAAFILLLAIIGAVFIEGSRSKSYFFKIWLATFLLTGGILMFMVLSPNTMADIINWINQTIHW